MCEMQKLRALVEQILAAAAEEIFGVFKRSISEIEEKLSDSPKHNKRNQRLPDAVHQTECPTPIEKLWMVKEELPLEQQERSPSLDQVDPEPPHIKEEENLWTNQDRELLQGLEQADITKFPSTPPHVKSEYDEDKAQSSQLHQSQTEENTQEPEDGDNHGESEPDSIQNNDFTISDVACKTTQHQCTEEDKTCMFLSVSERQMTVHTTKKPFSCSVCKKVFARKSHVKQHMAVHTGEKPFSCSVCNKGFATKSKLQRHMPVHTEEKPFSCSVCKKGFTRKSLLKEHMSVHTGEKPFRCSVCNKGFARKSEVKQHMSVHTRERPFSCSVCNKGFARKSEVKQHMTVHTGEKPFSCSVCKNVFAYKQNLKKHMLIHTGKKTSIH